MIVSANVPAGSVIVSAPALTLAARIASRSEQSASQLRSLVSEVLVTGKVAAAAVIETQATTTYTIPRSWQPRFRRTSVCTSWHNMASTSIFH